MSGDGPGQGRRLCLRGCNQHSLLFPTPGLAVALSQPAAPRSLHEEAAAGMRHHPDALQARLPRRLQPPRLQIHSEHRDCNGDTCQVSTRRQACQIGKASYWSRRPGWRRPATRRKGGWRSCGGSGRRCSSSPPPTRSRLPPFAHRSQLQTNPLAQGLLLAGCGCACGDGGDGGAWGGRGDAHRSPARARSTRSNHALGSNRTHAAPSGTRGCQLSC